jgi:hypothetical protein
MTIKIEKISASIYKFIDDGFTPAVPLFYDTEKRLYSADSLFSYGSTALMSNNDWDMLKSWCKAQDLPFPNSEPEPEPSILSACEKYWAILEGTEPLPVVKRGVQADSVNVTLAKADTGQYRIEWRNSESGKTRFIVHCYGCANSLQVARGIAFAQCAKVTHPMSKPSNDLSDHP